MSNSFHSSVFRHELPAMTIMDVDVAFYAGPDDTMEFDCDSIQHRNDSLSHSFRSPV